VDSKGRPRSKVRFGRWSFVTSLLDQAAYERVLALMLSDTAVVDARAEYLRADGQGVFVTVWGRRCTVGHVYEHFDSRGTNGRQPSCILYFSLTAEEMGREAGTAGPFVMPPPRSYAAPAAAAATGAALDDLERAVGAEFIETRVRSSEQVKKISSFEDILANPKEIFGKTADEVEAILGKGWSREPYNGSSTATKFTKNGEPGTSVIVNYGGGIHSKEVQASPVYYKITSGKSGRIKIIDKNNYIRDPKERRTIIIEGN
jgi:hypothetical protein